jgi:hypothetical protein
MQPFIYLNTLRQGNHHVSLRKAVEISQVAVPLIASVLVVVHASCIITYVRPDEDIYTLTPQIMRCQRIVSPSEALLKLSIQGFCC